jgi:hypothetical protein
MLHPALRRKFIEGRPYTTASVFYWSGFLTANPEGPGSIPGVPDFLSSCGSRTGSTQPL